MEKINPYELIYIGSERYLRVSEISEVSLKDVKTLRIVMKNSNEYYLNGKDNEITKFLFRILHLISGNYAFIADELIVLESFVNIISD